MCEIFLLYPLSVCTRRLHAGSLCLEEYSEQPSRMLPCGHTFCTECISRMKINECPDDRTAFQQPAQSLPKNFDLLHITQSSRSSLPASASSNNGTCPEHKEAFRYFDTARSAWIASR